MYTHTSVTTIPSSQAPNNPLTTRKGKARQAYLYSTFHTPWQYNVLHISYTVAIQWPYNVLHINTSKRSVHDHKVNSK